MTSSLPQSDATFEQQSTNLIDDVTVYAGSGVRDKEIDGAPAASSPLFNPYAMAADANGNLYVMCADSLNV